MVVSDPGESQRWMQLYEADPVNHLKLSDALRSQLVAGSAAHGPPFTAALQVRCYLPAPPASLTSVRASPPLFRMQGEVDRSQALDPSLQAQLKPIISG